MPAATVVLATTTGVAWFVYSPVELKQFTSSAVATAVYLSNFWFAHLSTDYLAEGTDPNPLLHTRSLGVKKRQFYLVWPLLLLGVSPFEPLGRRRRRLFWCFGTSRVAITHANYLAHDGQPAMGIFRLADARLGVCGRRCHFVLATKRTAPTATGTPMLMGLAGALAVVPALPPRCLQTEPPFPVMPPFCRYSAPPLPMAAGRLSPTTGIDRLLRISALRFKGNIYLPAPPEAVRSTQS